MNYMNMIVNVLLNPSRETNFFFMPLETLSATCQ